MHRTENGNKQLAFSPKIFSFPTQSVPKKCFSKLHFSAKNNIIHLGILFMLAAHVRTYIYRMRLLYLSGQCTCFHSYALFFPWCLESTTVYFDAAQHCDLPVFFSGGQMHQKIWGERRRAKWFMSVCGLNAAALPPKTFAHRHFENRVKVPH